MRVNHTTGPGWTPKDLRRLLSPGRFDKYVEAAGEDEEKAAALYVWNNRVGGALYEALGQFEVILRNALDRELAAYHRRHLNGDGNWHADRQMPWDTRHPMLANLADARSRATGDGRHPEIRGKVIAELSLGFWRRTLTSSYQNTLWTPRLRHAFPYMRPQRRNDVYLPVDRLYRLRNRLAHHEPIHGEDLGSRYDDLLQVAGWIDPAGAAWIAETGRVRAVLAARP